MPAIIKFSSSNFLVTTEYIPTATAISNLSTQAYLSGKTQESINFLNSKAAVLTLNTAPKKIYNDDLEFEVVIDESKNIFAA